MVFRRATSVRTWPEGKFEWSGTTETYHWLEVKPDLWIGTSRLCESEAEAKTLRDEIGHGEKKTKSMALLSHTRFLRLTADPDTFEIFDPA